MKNQKADVVVIGSGPGGQNAAIEAARMGKKVILFEKEAFPGGFCLNSGAIPSKSLREAILNLSRFHESSFYGINYCEREISIGDLNYRLNKVLEEQRKAIIRRFREEGVSFIQGTASFLSSHELLIKKNGGESFKVNAEVVVIATGSRPRNPNNIPFDHKAILDSSSLLSIGKLPRRALIFGFGIVASEYASFFGVLGVSVTCFDKKKYVLPFLDQEIRNHLETELSNLGVNFITGVKVERVFKREGKVVSLFSDAREVEGEVLICALGREPVIEDLNLKEAGIFIDDQGFIKVDSFFQTDAKGVYAVGDVIGGVSLASTSIEQGRLAMLYAFERRHSSPSSFYPFGIYTIPEISFYGVTEEQLKRNHIPYLIGRAYYNEIARGTISGSKSGLIKIIFHKESKKILGIHIIGREATELIHIGQVAMSFSADIDYFIHKVFNYPTFAEGYRIAALDAYGKLRK